MKLVHRDTQKEAAVGDAVISFKGDKATIRHFVEPHKPSSSGHVSVDYTDSVMPAYSYVTVWGLEWIDREDRPRQKACDWHEKDTDCEECP